MIRKYKNSWGVILPRGGGVCRFKTEADARAFVLVSTLFEDVWPSDDAEDIEDEQPMVTPMPEDEVAQNAPEEQTEAPEEND